jgi:hypothetical protein
MDYGDSSFRRGGFTLRKSNIMDDGNPKEEIGGKTLKVSTVITGIVITVMTVGLGRGCARSILPDKSPWGRIASVTPPPALKELYLFEVAGLSLKLPTPPKKMSVALPSEAWEMMDSMDSYESKKGSTHVVISHTTYKFGGNLDGAAAGAISQARLNPGATEFSSNTITVSVDGMDGRIVEINCRISGHIILTYGLIFGRGNEMWQVVLVGPGASHKDAFELFRDEIFKSVSILD